MIGLIKKDLLMLKGNCKVFIIMLLIYTGLGIYGQADLSFLIPFMSFLMMMTTFNYDAYNKWDAYVVTLPNGRKNSVKAKYLATLILILVASIIVTILSLIIAYSKNNTDYESLLLVILGCTFATVLLEVFMYPAIYKFGVEKARIGVLVIVFAIIFVEEFMRKYIDFYAISKVFDVFNDYIFLALPITMVLSLFISYSISASIYMKKEF
ncbi:MAG: ABC-2 transporter permease [Erysipelotrichales bacterium]|nr:ABC-2 transporter permease [Erysipelotrichales bacterium]